MNCKTGVFKFFLIILNGSLATYSLAMTSAYNIQFDKPYSEILLDFAEDHDIQDKKVVSEFYEAHYLARGIVVRAYNNFQREPQKKFALKLLRQFDKVELRYRKKGSEKELCKSHPSVYAFVNNVFGYSFNDVWICPKFIGSGLTPEQQAQVLIHEYIHTLNYKDECETTSLEWQIMLASGIGEVWSSYHALKCLSESY